MPTEEPLITALIDQIHKGHLLVAESVSARLKDLLNGKLSERQLTEVELRKVATGLIEAMATASPKGEAK
jgi:hypothetical protein